MRHYPNSAVEHTHKCFVTGMCQFRQNAIWEKREGFDPIGG